MANAKKGSSGNPKHVEKKDLPPRASRSDHRGSQVHENIESPQLDQARGKRTAHSLPGRKDSGEPNPDTVVQDNTRPGGNRPKGREKGKQGGLDHN